jgi:hypothetical protein
MLFIVTLNIRSGHTDDSSKGKYELRSAHSKVEIAYLQQEIKFLWRDSKNLRKEIDSIDAFTKWSMGIMVLVVIGLFGIAIRIALRK